MPGHLGPRRGVHALGGGIGQGVQMAVGARLRRAAARRVPRRRRRRMVNLGELGPLMQDKADVVIVLMNDHGYGVIRNIQDAYYGGRRHYADLHTPDFGALAAALGLPHHPVRDLGAVRETLRKAVAMQGPAIVEIDMPSIGGFAKQFAGPPVRKLETVKD